MFVCHFSSPSQLFFYHFLVISFFNNIFKNFYSIYLVKKDRAKNILHIFLKKKKITYLISL